MGLRSSRKKKLCLDKRERYACYVTTRPPLPTHTDKACLTPPAAAHCNLRVTTGCWGRGNKGGQGQSTSDRRHGLAKALGLMYTCDAMG